MTTIRRKGKLSVNCKVIEREGHRRCQGDLHRELRLASRRSVRQGCFRAFRGEEDDESPDGRMSLP
jgi:hypothetical protein